MKDSATKSFEQSYNCQAAVDGHGQVIVDSLRAGKHVFTEKPMCFTLLRLVRTE
jgi:hypothetical protein